jgi:hypothetical protein
MAFMSFSHWQNEIHFSSAQTYLSGRNRRMFKQLMWGVTSGQSGGSVIEITEFFPASGIKLMIHLECRPVRLMGASPKTHLVALKNLNRF